MASLGSLVIELAANTARLQSDMGKAAGIAERGAKQIYGAFKGLAGGLLGSAILGLAKQSIQLGDDLNKAAIKAGVSGRAISELAYAAKQSDIDLQSLSGALQKMQVALSKAASGSKEQNTALAALGLTIEDIKSLEPDRQFELLADRISKLSNPADRARAAVELFGKAGANLLPLFEQGAAGIRAAREEAQRFGASLGTEQIQRLADADDAIKRLTGSFQGMAATLTAAVAPGLAQVLDNINALFTGDRILKLKEQIDFLERMRGRSFVAAGYGDIGTGFFTAAEGEKKLAELQNRLATLTRTTGRGGRGGRASGELPGFQSAAEDAKKAAKEVKDAFELDPETLDRISFEDWKRETVQATDDVVRASQDMEAEMQRIGDDMQDSWKEATNELSTFADQAARNMQDAFADFLFDPFENGIKGMLKGFVDILRRMVAEAAAAKVFEALGFGQSGGGSGGLLGKLFGGLLGGAGGGKVLFPMPRAMGGPVTAGAPYLVGERGPELFVPGVSGGIVPNGRMGGASIVINNNIDARGATSEFINALPEILRRNNAQVREDIIEGLRRGRY